MNTKNTQNQEEIRNYCQILNAEYNAIQHLAELEKVVQKNGDVGNYISQKENKEMSNEEFDIEEILYNETIMIKDLVSLKKEKIELLEKIVLEKHEKLVNLNEDIVESKRIEKMVVDKGDRQLLINEIIKNYVGEDTE